MTDAQRGGEQTELSESLLALRKHAGLNQVTAAEAAGITQAQVSLIERGKRLPKQAVVAKLLAAYGVKGDTYDRVCLLAEAAHAELLPARVIVQHGAHNFQRRIRELEERATEVCSLGVAVVLGSAQTPAYASAVFRQGTTAADAEKSVAERMARRQLLMDDPDRQWTLLQTEGALLWALDNAAVMAEQLDSMVEMSRHPNVRLGIIPARTPAPVLAPHGFHLYHHPAGWQVSYGTRDGTVLISDEQKVGGYRELFGAVAALAVYDHPARKLLTRIADDYRRMVAR